VACGERTTLLELFDAIKQRVAAYRPDAASAALREEPPRAGDIAHSLADIGRAKKSLGYLPAYDVARGLELGVPWYARHCAPVAQLFA
jgi:UDP-N-acetylglucosamine 4-epimerase